MNTTALLERWKNGGPLACPHGSNWQRTGHAQIESFTDDGVPSEPAEPLSVIELGHDNTILDLLFDEDRDKVAILTMTQEISIKISCCPSRVLNSLKYVWILQIFVLHPPLLPSYKQDTRV